MELLDWGYSRRYNIKAVFDRFPNSLVVFRMIRDYYFVYIVNWSEDDPIVTRPDLKQMELLLNQELGTLGEYRKRKTYIEDAGTV
ncbi:hypothetical protein [Pseudalkalibacillus caeni]|uniref:Uncharacterized protein n=1 Tax=Exobacillus caeni TaxID=2574798 RepID=A0A5R9FC01_9BACL|nr:hypothetical protein [Pseudalkalibacillus caeni]TLS37175.1 hypothetical protein FCL54_11655 [Pseudalkalibacillus caeni]